MRTWAKTGVPSERLCNAPLKGIYRGTCERYGDALYGGRCWQHRPITDADRAEAKQIRIARRRAEDDAAAAGAANRAFGELGNRLIEELLAMREKGCAVSPAQLERRIDALVEARKACVETRRTAEASLIALKESDK